MSRRIIVTDAGRGAAVAMIRSLGRSGAEVIAADSEGRSPGFYSRHTVDRLRYPSPRTDPEGVISVLLHAAEERRVDLIVPCGDELTLLLSEERERFGDTCALALPDRSSYATTQDKLATIELAREHDVPVPRTTVVSSVEQAREAAESLGWPLVLKPRASSIRSATDLVEHLEVSYAEDRDSLDGQIERAEGRFEFLLQEYYRGEGHGVELLLDRGRPLVAFQHRRLHEVPITGGASSLRESVGLDPTLYAYSSRLLAALDWTGLAMVEFKVGEQGPKLMEINGRVWGSLPLAVKSGVDFPARMAELYLTGASGNGRPPDTAYRLGVRSRNLGLEVVWIASTLRGRRGRRLVLVPRRRDGVGAAMRLLYPGDGFDILSREDPRPGMAELAAIAGKLRRKVRS